MKEAIILAGGLGTRLRSVIDTVPKVMASINEKPFLEYILLWLEKYNIKRVILAVGYKHEIIEDYFGSRFNNIKIIYSLEKKPLGTGGAIKLAIEKIEKQDVVVINGDTFFNVDLKEMYRLHIEKNLYITIALKPLTNFDRYGTVIISENDRIVEFVEKATTSKGLINGGVYIIKNVSTSFLPINGVFSFEKDFLEKHLDKFNIGGYICNEYFIDIGIPKDYTIAQKGLPLL